MRVVYPSVTETGLGNNLITVAKAYLIAESCRMTYQPPVWPPTVHVRPQTKNGYGYYFPSTMTDKIQLCMYSYLYRFQKKLDMRIGLPVLHFDREQYESTGTEDIGEACLAYLRAKKLDDPAKSVVVTTTGMWGGYASVRRARSWLCNLLLSHSDTRRRLQRIEAQADKRLRIAVNIRMGDFKPSTGEFQPGERLSRIPLDWYIRTCRNIREVCDCSFILVTDGTREELLPFLNEINPVQYLGEPYSDLLGVLLLSRSDLVICSNSTYSRLACFLNDKPYIWLADTLIRDASGRYGYLWGGNGSAYLRLPVKSSNGIYDGAIQRCFPLPYGSSLLPEGLKRYLTSNGRLPIEVSNDLLYGEPVPILA